MQEKMCIHPAYKIEMVIEPKIKPLVDILNRVPYIKTISSCEGHYDLEDYRKHKANVMFQINKNKEKELENLIKEIHIATRDNWTLGLVNIMQRLYMCPENPVLYKQWLIEIEPFNINWGITKKRSVTDFLINSTIRGIENYIESKKIR